MSRRKWDTKVRYDEEMVKGMGFLMIARESELSAKMKGKFVAIFGPDG
jgi:hypothetical protein